MSASGTPSRQLAFQIAALGFGDEAQTLVERRRLVDFEMTLAVPAGVITSACDVRERAGLQHREPVPVRFIVGAVDRGKHLDDRRRRTCVVVGERRVEISVERDKRRNAVLLLNLQRVVLVERRHYSVPFLAAYAASYAS